MFGPTRSRIFKNPNAVIVPASNNPSDDYGLLVIDIDSQVAGRTKSSAATSVFSNYFANAQTAMNRISSGDVVDVTIWEAPPALLFGTASDLNGFSGTKETKLPEQMVDKSGYISIPFVGKLNVIDKTLTSAGYDYRRAAQKSKSAKRHCAYHKE